MGIIATIRFWASAQAMKLAMWLEPNIVRNAMASTFFEQMRERGIVSIDFGVNEEGEETMVVRHVSDLPRVVKH